jgi:hypothetical protein
MKRTGIREVSTRRRARAEAFTPARIGARWDALDLAENAEGVMRIREQFGRGRPVISFEFFPPKTEAGFDSLFRAIAKLKELSPAFVSVTWGAAARLAARRSRSPRASRTRPASPRCRT